MKKIKNYSFSLLILIWVGINQVYWQLAPHISSYTNESLHTSLSLGLQAVTAIGPDLAMLSLGLLTAHQAAKQAEGFIVKTWLNTLVLGGTVCGILMLISNYILPTAVYDALFPVLRNSYPLITGVLVGIILSAIINQLPKVWQQGSTYLIILLITLPLFSTPNMFGWQGQNMAIFYALLFVLGQFGFKFLTSRYSTQQWLLIGTGAFLVNMGLQLIMPSFSISGDTIQRYATPANILAVTTAFAIVLLGKKHLRFSPWLVLSYLVIIESSAVKLALLGLVEHGIGHSSFKTGLIAVVTVALALALASLWNRLRRLAFIRRRAHLIKAFTGKPLNVQLTLFKNQLTARKAVLFQILFAYLLALISIVAMNDGWRIKPNAGLNYNVFAYLLGQRQLIIILNALFILAAIKFIQTITRRYWVSLFTVLLVNAILIIANREKISARAEPILPADLAMLKVGKQLFGMVSGGVWLSSGLGLVLIVALTI